MAIVAQVFPTTLTWPTIYGTQCFNGILRFTGPLPLASNATNRAFEL